MIKFMLVGPQASPEKFAAQVQQRLNDGWELHGSVGIVRSATYPNTDYYVQPMILKVEAL